MIERDLVKEDINAILYEEMYITHLGNGMNVVTGYDEAVERITKYIKEFYVSRD